MPSRGNRPRPTRLKPKGTSGDQKVESLDASPAFARASTPVTIEAIILTVASNLPVAKHHPAGEIQAGGCFTSTNRPRGAGRPCSQRMKLRMTGRPPTTRASRCCALRPAAHGHRCAGNNRITGIDDT